MLRDQGEPLNMGGYQLWPAWRVWVRQAKTAHDIPHVEKNLAFKGDETDTNTGN